MSEREGRFRFLDSDRGLWLIEKDSLLAAMTADEVDGEEDLGVLVAPMKLVLLPRLEAKSDL